MTTVPLSTRIPIARANPPSVKVLSVCPATFMNSTAVMMESGMDARMITDSRTLPRNMMMTRAVNPAAMHALKTTLLSAAFTNSDWSNRALMVTSFGRTFLISVRAARTPSMTARVDTPPVFRIVIRAPGVPLTDTEFVCRPANPSCTCATSRMNTVRPSTCLMGEGVDGFDDIRRVVHRQRVILVSDLHVAGRQNDVLTLQRRAHVRGRQTPRLQRLRVQIDHDHARLPAIRIRNRRPAHHRQSRANDVLPQVIQFRVGQRFTRQAELNDRYVGGAVAQHQRRSDVRRHVLEHHQGAAGQLRNGAGDVGALVQVDLFHPDAVIADGLDARNVIDQGRELPLVQGQDTVLDVLRAHPVVGPDHRHHRNINFRKDVDGHAQGPRRFPSARSGSTKPSTVLEGRFSAVSTTDMRSPLWRCGQSRRGGPGCQEPKVTTRRD